MIKLKSDAQAEALGHVLCVASESTLRDLTIAQTHGGSLRVATKLQSVDINPDGIVMPHRDYPWNPET